MDKLKISFTKKIADNDRLLSKLSNIIHQSLSIVFVNFGNEIIGLGNLYGMFIDLESGNNSLEIKCVVSENNSSLKILNIKDIPSSAVVTASEKCLINNLMLEIVRPNENVRPPADFFKLLDDLDALPITKNISKVEKEKEVLIWEKYIRAVKALYKNQEDIFKIIKVGELHKNSIELTIQKENWRNNLNRSLEEKFPQYPILNANANFIEFAIDNSLNGAFSGSKAIAEVLESVQDDILQIVKENFFKIEGKPSFVTQSYLKLNVFDDIQKGKIGQEISAELLEKFGIVAKINEHLSTRLSLEDVTCLESILTKHYRTLRLLPIVGTIKLINNEKSASAKSKIENNIQQINAEYKNPKITFYDNVDTVELRIKSKFDVREFEEKYNLSLKLVRQIFTVKDSGALEYVTGAVIKEFSYFIEGSSLREIYPVISNIRKKYGDISKTSFVTDFIFSNAIEDVRMLGKDKQAVLYTEGIRYSPQENEIDISFSNNEEFNDKLEVVKSVLSDTDITYTKPETFFVNIRQTLEDPAEINFLLEKSIKKPLLAKFGKSVKFDYEAEKNVFHITWTGNFDSTDVTQSLKNILTSGEYDHLFEPNFKVEFAQILGFHISEDVMRLNDFTLKRERTFSAKGSLYLLTNDDVFKFMSSQSSLIDQDFGVNIGSIESWKNNRITVNLGSRIVAKIKSTDNREISTRLQGNNFDNPDDWLGLFLKPTLSGDITQYRRLSYAIERVMYPSEPRKRSFKNRLPLFNERLPNFIFDSSTARPITVTDEIITPLNNLNEKQLEAVKKAINTKDLFILQGPPGTGKTTVIAEIIYQILKRQPNSKILLTSQTHLAVDNALERLADQSIVKPLRLGTNPDSFEEEGQKYFEGYINLWASAEPGSAIEEKYKKNPVSVWINNIIQNVPTDPLFKDVLDNWKLGLCSLDKMEKELLSKRYATNFNVVGATCSLTGSDFGFLNKYNFAKEGFDYVIFDEASKATPPELLIPLLSGKAIIIIGDHKQLPPMIDENDFEEKLKEVGEYDLAQEIGNLDVEKSQFEKLFRSASINNPSIITTLDTQYRMHSDIMEVIDQFYQEEGGLKCGLDDMKINVPDFKEKASRWHGLNYKDGTFLSADNHVIWVNVDDYEKKVGTSFTNEGEISAIDKILTLLKASDGFNKLLNYSSKEDDREVGLITFYGEQKKLLKKMVMNNHDDLAVRINTVDKFQGMERNIIIVSTVRNNKDGAIGFAEKLQRINVAFSRPRRLLIIVGNIDHFAFNKKNVPFYSRIKSIVEHQNGKRDKKQLDNI